MHNELKFAGFWKRIWCMLLDLVLYSCYFFSITMYDETIYWPSDTEYIFLFIALLIVPLVLVYLLWIFLGGSIGMLIGKLQIVDIKTGKKPSAKKILLRILGNFISGISFLISYLSIALDSRRQSWHDKLAGTIVVIKTDSTLQDIPAPVPKDKKYFKIELVVFTILMLTAITFELMNIIDEPLLPGAEKWMQPIEIIEPNPEENGFYHLVGFACPENTDPSEAGYNWVKQINKLTEKRYYFDSKTYNDSLDLDLSSNTIFAVDTSIISKRLELDTLSYLKYFEVKSEVIDSLSECFSFMLSRLSKIAAFDNYNSALIPTTNFCHAAAKEILDIKMLRLYCIEKEFYLGNKKASLNMIEDDMKLACRLINNTQSSHIQALGVSMLSLDLLSVSFILDRSEENTLELDFPKITPDRQNWETIAKHSFNAFYYTFIKQSWFYDDYIENRRIQKLVLNLDHKMNLNKLEINPLYDIWKTTAELATLNAKDFYQRYNEVLDALPSDIMNCKPNEHALVMSSPDNELKTLSFYHNINGIINMLKLVTMIKQQNISAEEIPDFLEAQSDSLFNPYTEEVFKWDAENSKLYFEGPFEDEYYFRRKLKINF